MYRNVLKPLLDFFIALILSMITFPLIFILIILIRIESKGNPIFCQKRVGKGGRLFTIYKLRTMKSNADVEGPHFTLENDKRITKVGRFLRRTSLDELPQIWNVLLFDMSLVGPRPDVLAQRNDYKEELWDKRNQVRPGITGLSQAKLRSQATFEQRLNYDLEYVNNISLTLDIKILLQTINMLTNIKKAN